MKAVYSCYDRFILLYENVNFSYNKMAGARPVSVEYDSIDPNWHGKLLRQAVQNASIL